MNSDVAELAVRLDGLTAWRRSGRRIGSRPVRSRIQRWL